MKSSPLQLSTIQYPKFDFRADPKATPEQIAAPLVVAAEGSIGYDTDGDHFASIVIRTVDPQAYALTLEAIATFRMDIEACRATYKDGFNPAVIAVNVIRLLYSSCREFVATVTSRAPYGTASLPSVVLETSDVSLGFEEKRRDEILATFFEFTDAQLQELREAINRHETQKGASHLERSKPKKKASKARKRPVDQSVRT